ncbi:MAG: serine hydrolase domain-containing protein [Candidatus Hydrogenedentota bacterium]
MSRAITKSRCLVSLVALILVVSGSGCTFLPHTTPSSETLTKRFQNTLDDLQREHKFPGATAAVLLPDDTIIAVATGYADRDKKILMHPSTQQYIGDVGMTFVAALALALVHDERLDLDRPVQNYLDTRGQDAWFLEIPNAGRITMRHLLTHTSGLRDVSQENESIQPANQVNDSTRLLMMSESWTGTANGLESEFRPGAGFNHSRMGYLLAGIVLERISGQSIEELLEQRLIGPRDLSRTSHVSSEYPDAIATGYAGDHSQSNTPRWVSSALISNPHDLVRWAKGLYQEDLFDRPYLEDLLASGYRGSDRNSEYGLGVYIYETTAGEAYGHTGSYPGFETNLIYFPRHEIAVCIQVNSSYDNDIRAYVQELAQVILNSLPR